MTISILEIRKYQLITKITQLEDEGVSKKLEVLLNRLDGDLLNRVKPLRKKTKLEEITEEQHFKGFDRAKFDQLIEEMDIQEPVEQLLEILS